MKLVTVSWDKVCSPRRNGGLNIKSLKSINKVSILKLAWDMLTNSNQWSNMVKAWSNMGIPCQLGLNINMV